MNHVVSLISALGIGEAHGGDRDRGSELGRARGRPHATSDPSERARRQERLQLAEATFDAIPFDAAAARAYGQVYAEAASSGRKARGRRALDLLIAATALAAQLPLYTCNPPDFDGLDALIEVTAVRPSTSTD